MASPREVIRVVKAAKCKLRDWFICSRMRKQLSVNGVSIIANDCVGGWIYHDLGLRFDSPTINCFLSAADYVRFCSNLHHYLHAPLEEMDGAKVFGVYYPVGVIDDIIVHFVHYDSFPAAKKKWEQRSKRVDFNHLLFIMNDRNGCTYNLAKQFDRIPVSQKVLLSSKAMDGVECCKVINGHEENGHLGIVSAWQSPVSLRKVYDSFDYVSMVNAAGKSE